MKQLSYVLLTAVLALAAASCGDDESSESGPGGGDDYEVNASVEGGEAAGSVQGSSDTAVPTLYSGSVTNGELVVSLSSNDARIILFTADVASTEMPGSVPVTRALDEDAYLSLTEGMTATIYEGSSGSISVGACPNTTGAIVSGTFNDVGLVNVMSEMDSGTLTGSWQVQISISDGSALCSSGGGGGEDPGPSPGPSCQNPVCDGPCCPYLPALQSCTLACAGTNDCMDPITGNPMTCMACFAGCPEESGMTADAVCMSAAEALDACSQTHGCDMSDATEENACIADNCCSEYQATF